VPGEALDETTSLYALVQTLDGVALYPPLGPELRTRVCTSFATHATTLVRTRPQARSTGTKIAGQPRRTAQFVSSYVP
jgi:hypothetical protein